MATTTAVGQKQLIHFVEEAGVGIIEMDDQPANTYTYEMMQQLDAAILRARMDENAVGMIVASEVPTATCMRMPGSMPISAST